MKVAVVGCGALGSFYGARLCRSGEEVHFLLRSDYEVVRRQGVCIRSIDGDFQVRPQCACQPGDIGVADLVLIGLKTTANQEFSRLLPPLTGPNTLIITLQNGLGNEEQLAAVVNADNILCGLCFVCLNRLEPGVIRHTAHGRIILGEYQRPALPRTRQLAELFQRSGTPCEVTQNLEQAHWEKLVWNIPFNGLGVAGVAGYEALITGQCPMHRVWGPCLATDLLLADPKWEQLVREVMREVLHTANALGYRLSFDLEEQNIVRTRCMGTYKASTLIDFERGFPLELDGLFLRPLAQARQAGIAAPRLSAMCEILKKLDPGTKTMGA